jgi:hypothetical protein
MDSTELGVPATFFSPSPLFANRDPPAASDSLKIQRAAHRPAAALEDVGIDDVGIDHGGAYILVAQEFLHRADVIASWVAKEWRRVWGVTGLVMPARGSSERREEGKTHCQPHSRSALGYLRAKASGR